jgi:hypothetical protein
MTKTCKYPKESCPDRYFSNKNNHTTPFCRLTEWKKKSGVCPYDPGIQSKTKPTLRGKRDKHQLLLEEVTK